MADDHIEITTPAEGQDNLENPITTIVRDNLLGSGGFGVVFLGRATRENGAVERVAVKQINITPADIGQPVEVNFRREAEILFNLDHYNIVKFYCRWNFPWEVNGFVVDYPHPNALVMEYMPQGSLAGVMDNHRANGTFMSWRQRIITLMDITCGLDYMHKFNPRLIHRDLKPHNVLLVERDGLLTAKLADFGLTITQNTVTRAGGEPGEGTYEYLAPETIDLHEEPIYSESSDIYALAIIMWELATHRMAYDGLGMGLVMDRVRNRMRLELPAEDVCSRELTGLMEDCWTHERTARPSAEAVIDRLAVMPENNDPRLPGRLVSAITEHNAEAIWPIIRRDPRLLIQVLANDRTAFHLACEVGTIDIVVRLVERLGDNFADVRTQDTADWQPVVLNEALEAAIASGHTEQVIQLLSWGAEISLLSTRTELEDARDRIAELETYANERRELEITLAEHTDALTEAHRRLEEQRTQAERLVTLNTNLQKENEDLQTQLHEQETITADALRRVDIIERERGVIAEAQNALDEQLTQGQAAEMGYVDVARQNLLRFSGMPGSPRSGGEGISDGVSAVAAAAGGGIGMFSYEDASVTDAQQIHEALMVAFATSLNVPDDQVRDGIAAEQALVQAAGIETPQDGAVFRPDLENAGYTYFRLKFEDQAAFDQFLTHYQAQYPDLIVSAEFRAENFSRITMVTRELIDHVVADLSANTAVAAAGASAS